MDKYAEANRRLHELMCIVSLGSLPWTEGTEPPWCSDWQHCGRLIGQYKVQVKPLVNIVAAKCGMESRHEAYTDHPDVDSAIRFAIVKVLITKLEKGQAK